MSSDYYIATNLPPDQLSELGIAVYEAWVKFALGLGDLGGNRLYHPTGRYASMIQFKQEGASRVAIMIDTSNKENEYANYIEEGHGRVDLKQLLVPGKTYAMHNEQLSPQEAVNNPFRRRRVTTGVSNSPSVWAETRRRELTPFSDHPLFPYPRMSMHPEMLDPDSWVIPPMVPYAPAKILADLLKQQLGS